MLVLAERPDGDVVGRLEDRDALRRRLLERVVETLLQTKAVGHDQVRSMDGLDVLCGWGPVVGIDAVAHEHAHRGRIAHEVLDHGAEHRVGDHDGRTRIRRG